MIFLEILIPPEYQETQARKGKENRRGDKEGMNKVIQGRMMSSDEHKIAEYCWSHREIHPIFTQGEEVISDNRTYGQKKVGEPQGPEKRGSSYIVRSK